MIRRRASLAATAALLISFAIPGCSAAPGAAPAPHPTLTRELPSDLSARGVLLAAVLLSEGDVERAVADGLVTPAEGDEAIRAIEGGALDVWAERAERELAGD